MSERVSDPLVIALVIVALAFLGLLGLGFYERRRTFDLLNETVQRVTMIAQAASSRLVPTPPPPGPLRVDLLPAGAARPVAPVPVGHDLEDDEVWSATKAAWEREALETDRAEQRRADIIAASLRLAQERRAAALAAEGKLAETVEPTELRSPSAPAP